MASELENQRPRGRSLAQVRQKLLQNPEVLRAYLDEYKREGYEQALDDALAALPRLVPCPNFSTPNPTPTRLEYDRGWHSGVDAALAQARANITKLKEEK